MPLPILHQDARLIAVNKPHGLLVHRSAYAANANEWALQMVRDQCGQRVYPVHRLDRKTSGVLLFAFDPKTASALGEQFQNRRPRKTYRAVVRGWFPETILVEKPLADLRGVAQPAETLFQCLAQTELNIPFGKHATSRYSLIEACPRTGRQHQIRRHLNHLRHPIIGDRPHGCNKQNRLFLERWQLKVMLLHALQLEVTHPATGEQLLLRAPYSSEFTRLLKLLHLSETTDLI